MLLDPCCAGCQRPGALVCATCAGRLRGPAGRPPPLGVDAWRAAFAYDDAARALLTSLKNGHRRDLVGWLAGRLATLGPPPSAIVTWAPTSPIRQRARGFDQAELLARALARRWGLRCRGLLRRRPGGPQAGLTGEDRRRHPGFVAAVRVPGPVLVVDDVATTGATLAAAAAALRAAGAAGVEAMVAARADG